MRQSFICINPKLTFHFFTKKIYLNFKENKKKLLNVMIFVCYWISRHSTKTLCIIFVSLIICTIADSSLYRIMKMSKYWSKMFIDQQINNNTWWCIQFSIRTTVSGLVRDTNSIYSKPCGCASERRWLFLWRNQNWPPHSRIHLKMVKFCYFMIQTIRMIIRCVPIYEHSFHWIHW